MRSAALGRSAFAGLAAALALSACGYGLENRYVAKSGAERVHVRPFENLSTEASLGAELTAALRDELARRGAAAGPGAPAEIIGEVRASAPGPSSPTPYGASYPPTWRIGVVVKARLVVDGATVSERTVRREADYLAGVGGDALETEGRRALALRRVADDAARELLRAFER
ncbi:LPS assembly lipoprotein LptE [Anaeromyxobacter terrae]|uniref:LPS assembly lipoprotein LptE n=1 Tax=Anaeromyxobacter terrae TaxID=2925406 RepID=UPI001F569E15|nr:LPS assembly lipoprotein LptE [Anaeromyxobacter sp. SG22]